MAVYVDNFNVQASVRNGTRTHSSTWCHMTADTLEELDAFAVRIGLRPSWRQDKPSGVHYDLTKGKRYQALRSGAIEVDVSTDEWLRIAEIARRQYVTLRENR